MSKFLLMVLAVVVGLAIHDILDIEIGFMEEDEDTMPVGGARGYY